MCSHELASVILYEGPNPKSIIGSLRASMTKVPWIQHPEIQTLLLVFWSWQTEIWNYWSPMGSVIVWPDDNQTCSKFKSWFSLSVSNRRGLLRLRLLYFLLSWHPFKSDNIDITSWYLNIERMKGRSALGTRHVQPGSMMQFAQPSSLNSGKMKEESLVRCTNPKIV